MRARGVLAMIASAGIFAPCFCACNALLTVDGNPGVTVVGNDGGGESGPKTCKGTIGVRIAYDMTGPTRDVGVPAGKGTYDYLREVNAQGGLRGCMLDLDVQDTKYDRPNTIGVYNAWKAGAKWSDVAAVFVQGTPMTEVVGPLASADGKVVISGSFAGEFGSPLPVTQNLTVTSLNDSFAQAQVPVSKQSNGFPFVFFQGTDYSTGARIGMNYAWSQGAKRVGFFRCSTSAFCTDPVDGAKTFLVLLGTTQIGRDLPIELADDAATIQTKIVTYFQQELAQKQSNPGYTIVDWVWAGNTAATTISIIKGLQAVKAQLGLTVSVIADNWGFNESVYATCGDACVGAVVEQPFPIFGDASVSGMATLLTIHQKYRQIDAEDLNVHSTVQYVYGYVAAATWKAAMVKLIDQGLPITSANLKQVMETFHNQDIEGFGAVSYSATDHRPQSTGRLYQLAANGKLQQVAQPISIALQPGWLGW